jgi:hypothetical protein
MAWRVVELAQNGRVPSGELRIERLTNDDDFEG